MRRINDGKISRNQMRDNGYALTQAQTEKAVKWLRKQKKDMGYRELMAIGLDTESKTSTDRKPVWKSMGGVKMELIDFYTPRGNYYFPYYRVSGYGHQFEYTMYHGKIHILG